MGKINRETVYKKYGERCAYCGRHILFADMQVDHMYPQRLGGSDNMENLMPSCRRCNHYKRANPLETYRSMLMDVKHKILDTYLGKIALDYGMIELEDWDGKFYFERGYTNESSSE